MYGWKYANIIYVFARVRRSTNILEYKLIFKRRVYLVVIVVSLRLFSAVKFGLLTSNTREREEMQKYILIELIGTIC